MPFQYMKIYNFAVLIEQDVDGLYLAKVPDLPGCHTQAKNLPQLYQRIQEAIGLCLEVYKNNKTPVPQNKFIGIQQIQVNL